MTSSQSPHSLASKIAQKDLKAIRVLVADDEVLLAQRFADFLNDKGFNARAVHTGSEVRGLIDGWTPDFIFYDLMLPELNALEFLRLTSVRNALAAGKMKVFVGSGHNDPRNVKQCIDAGASDYIAKPYRQDDLLQRLILHMHPKREVKPYVAPAKGDEREDAHFFLHLADLILREALKGLAGADTLHHLVGLLNHSFAAVRTSVVRCDPGVRTALVAASSDKRNMDDLQIDLVKYPEILYVVNHNKLLALDNLENDPTMQFVTRITKSIHFNSVLVAPIHIGSKIWGVLSVRLPEGRKKALSDAELRYAQLAANAIGLVVMRDASLLLKSPPAEELPAMPAAPVRAA